MSTLMTEDTDEKLSARYAEAAKGVNIDGPGGREEVLGLATACFLPSPSGRNPGGLARF